MVLMVIALVVLLTHTLLFSQVMTRRHPHILLMERKRCAAGIIASTWNEERTNGARVLCSRLEKLGFPCQVWPAYDGRTMSSAELMKLARSGTDVAPGPKRGWRGREGFDGVSNLANVLSHINLARHFARMEEEKEESFDCYMMFEDDAAITESFAPEFYSVLHTLEERNMKWDVLNLHGARKVAANSFACIFSDIVDSRWVGGSYTRSLSLIFSRNGLKKFLSLLPIDTHIDLFLDKHIASGDLRGLRTCMDYVDKAPVGLNSTIKSVNRDTSISRKEWEQAQKIYRDLHRHGRRKK